MSDTVIKVENVSKKYCRSIKHTMLYGATDLARSFLGLNQHTDILRNGEFWAVDNVNFELKRGETLGIIGPNGSGKSTMLKMLNGIFMPDKGRIEIKGRVGALIEVGAGFHPMLTGRENIYVNGSILGMSKKEMDERFDEIVEFADIGDFIDSPVKHYSSGMNVRLGVAVATCLQPEVLLIDEVLSVGDLSFQNKSLRRLAEIRENANAVVFVSHNLEHIRNLCQKVLLINKGKVILYGDSDEVLSRYHKLSREIYFEALKREKTGVVGIGHISTGDVMFHKVCVVDSMGRETKLIAEGEDIRLYFDFGIKNYIKDPSFSIGILNEKREICVWHMNQDNHVQFPSIEKGRYILKLFFKHPSLVSGIYFFNIAMRDSYSGETLERMSTPNNCFIIEGKKYHRGVVACESEWELRKIE